MLLQRYFNKKRETLLKMDIKLELKHSGKKVYYISGINKENQVHMRAKFVRGLDPKISMGVGTLHNMGREIKEADLNSGYGFEGNPGAIKRIFTKRSRLCLEFYYGGLEKPNGKQMHRKPYAELLMAQTGLDKFFSSPYIDYKARTYIWFPILPEHADKFPKDKDLLAESVKFERGRDPKTAMGVGLFGNMPKKGQMQKESFDLMNIAKTICKVYNLPIENYTPIDEKSNYVWNKGYQNQFLTMNLEQSRYIVAEFLGDEYWDRIEALMGEDYVPHIQLGISSHQMHWISKNDSKYEFDGNRVFCQVKGSGWRIPVDFRKISNTEDWLPDRVKDDIMQQAIWDLRYSEPLSIKKIPAGDHYSRDHEEIEIDVRIYCDEYSQEELENLMKQSYMWKTSVKNWKIEDGILKFRD